MTERTALKPLNPVKQVLIVIAAYLVAEIFMVMCAFLWVFVYSMFIYSEGDNAYYESYAQVSSPVVAVVLAGPTFFVVGRFLRRRLPDHAMKLALASGILGFIVTMSLVVATVEDGLVYSIGTGVLATIASLTGAYLGARPAVD